MKKLAFLVLIAVFFAACEKETIEPQIQNTDVQLKGANKPDKVQLWHLKGNGEYVLIEVAPSAVDAHLAHGDMLYCEPDFYQGFEENYDGWFEYPGPISLMDGYAVMEQGAFTWFDGPSDTWPENGWTAEIDVYLDPSWAEGAGFDYTVASYRTNGAHLRDFIFHVGVTENGLLVNGSNNTDATFNSYKLENENGGNYYVVTSAGWYSLQHQFYNDNGALSVDLNLLDANGNILWTATRTNASDLIPDVVGGNGYGWFTFISVENGIKVDETELYRGCAPM